MDPNFVLRLDRNPVIYPEGVLRRDPSFMPQLYFYSTESMGAGKCALYFFQAVAASAESNDQSVRVVDFLERKYPSETHKRKVNFAMDELAAKLYLAFDENSVRIFDLDFDPVDHLGYRRIRVRSDQYYVVETDPRVLCFLGSMAICPATGRLFGHYRMVGGVCRPKVKSQLAEIELPKDNDSVLIAKLSDHKFEPENASRTVFSLGIVFSNLGHLVIFYAFCNKRQSNKSAFVCSYDTDLNLVRCLAFDPVDVVSQCFPPGFGKMEQYPEAARSLLSMLMGQIHKYVLFQWASYVLAVKWPKNFYTGKHLPRVKNSRVIYLKDFMDQQQVCKYEAIILTDAHLYVLFQLKDKPNEIRRLALSPRFKDYRRCANCGQLEKGKRKNKDGKRVAQFKVCRLCKEKNFHLFYLNTENACHYCSDECVKQHWKIHKEVHKRSKLNRKKHCSKNLEKFD